MFFLKHNLLVGQDFRELVELSVDDFFELIIEALVYRRTLHSSEKKCF
jgi:hypothetical protein